MDIMSLSGPHHFADDFSLHTGDAGESAVDSLNNDGRPRSAAPTVARCRFVQDQSPKARQDCANSLLGRMECDRMKSGKLLNRKWRRGQDSNLHSLSAGGFQDRCTTIMRPLRKGN